MLKNFKKFMLNEAEGSTTKIETIRLNIAKEFDLIRAAKAEKKPNDSNSEVDSITKQSVSYGKISDLMKSLAVEIKGGSAGNKPKTTIY